MTGRGGNVSTRVMMRMTRKQIPMTHKWRALAKDSRGSAFVEFALLAPVFFLVILGIIDFGMMMWTSNTVEHAATEGARYAAVRGSDKPAPASEAQVRNYVKDQALGVALKNSDVDVSWANNSNVSGSSVTVEVTFTYSYIIGGLMNFDPVELEGSSTMVIN